MDDIVPNLDHPDAQIRGDAINCLADCVTKFDEGLAGRLVLMLADEEPFVQRIATKFVQSCESRILGMGVLRAAEMRPDTVFAELPRYTGNVFYRIHRPKPTSLDCIAALVSHEDAVAQRFGVALSARARLIVDTNFLEAASAVKDEECQNILKWAVERTFHSSVEIVNL